MKVKKNQQSKKKMSIFKLSNKKLNKLSKQGKLKKAIGRKKLIPFLKERVQGKKEWVEPENNVKVEEDIPIQEADYEYFAKEGRDLSFLTELSKETQIKPKENKRKKKNCEEFLKTEGKYENENRKKCIGVQMKELLPIKSKEKGIIPRMVPVEEDEVEKEKLEIKKEEVNESINEFEEKKETEVEKFVNRRLKIEKMKDQITNQCKQIMQDIDQNINQLPGLLDLLTSSLSFSLPLTRFLIISLSELFNDIIPDYKIRVLSEQEKQQKMKKETLNLLSSEEIILTNYKRFIQSLDHFVKGQYSLNEEGKKNSESMINKKRILRRISLEAINSLLWQNYHFNHRTDIVIIIVKALFHHDTKTSDLACKGVSRLFQVDKKGEVTLEIVRLIGRGIKAKKYDVKPEILNTFLSLRIKSFDINNEEDIEKIQEERKKKKKQEIKKRKLMSRNDKKREKEMKNLEKELKDVAMEDDQKIKKKIMTELINMVFLTYFRVLKLSTSSKLLPPVLEGLAKYAHMINASYFDDLFSVLTRLVQNGGLTNRESLHCIQTALILLSGQGSAFNIDPLKFYVHLYNILFSLNFKTITKDHKSMIDCLDMMLVKRRKQMPEVRVNSFLKRIFTLALSLPSSSSVPLILFAKSVLATHPRPDLLLDTEHQGSGFFLPHHDNPDHCNAQNSALYELCLLKKSYDEDMREVASHILHEMPSSGKHQLQTHLLSLRKDELYNDDLSHVLSKLNKINFINNINNYNKKINYKNSNNVKNKKKFDNKFKNENHDRKKSFIKLKYNNSNKNNLINKKMNN